MHWTPFLLLPLISTALSGVLAWYCWQRRSSRIAFWFAVTALAQAQWTLCYLFETASPALSSKIFWNNLQFIGLSIAPPAMLILALEYAGLKKWLTRGLYALLALPSLLNLALVWTDSLHGWVRLSPRIDTAGFFPALAYEYGAWSRLSLSYLFMLVLAAGGVLIGKATRSPGLYRRQMGVVVAGLLVGWSGKALTILGAVPVPLLQVDLSPVTLALGNLIWAWGIWRLQLFDIAPITRYTVIESATDGVLVLDNLSRLVDLNPAAQQMLGVAANRVIGQPAAQVLGLDLDRTEIALGDPPRYYGLRPSTLRDDAGAPTGQMVLLRDITDLKRAEQELRQSEERYHTLVELLPDAVIYLDLTGKFLLCNRQAAMLYEVPTAQDLVGCNAPDFIAPEDLDRVIQSGQQILATRRAQDMECTLVRRSGERFPGEVALSVITDDQDHPLGFIVVARDISARKQVEEAIRQINTQLEQRVTERTSELTQANQQLEQQVAERTRAEQALSLESATNAAVAEISGALLRSASMAEIAYLVLESARLLTDSATGFAGHIDPQAGYLVCPVAAAEIWDPYRVANEINAYKTKEGPWGWALEQRQPMYTNAAEQDTRVCQASSPTLTGQAPAPIHRLLAVPALFGHTLVGQLALANSLRDYTDHDLALIERLAILYALAIQRQREQEAVQESELRYRNLFENAPVCIFEVDMRWMPPLILRANRRANDVYGWPPEEMISASLEKLLPPSAMADVQRLLESSGRGETITLETANLRREGATFPARMSITQETALGFSRGVITVEDLTAEKQRRSEEEAIAEERRRIAREIHDGLAQDLASLRFRARLWHKLVENDPAQLHAELDALRDILSKNIREVRRSIFALRPVTLDDLGFYPALQQFAADFGEQNQLHIDLRVAGPQDRLPTHLEPVLFRITQEALNNVGKHARARTIWVTLNLEALDHVALAVRDDGAGFDTALLHSVVRDGHLGLAQMRERVENLGGTFAVHSQVGQGTEIQVALPLSRSA